jgi:zinc transport system substrate-binding protein
MRRASPAWLLALLLAAAPAAADPPRVVASIKPVHSLVAAVMDGVAVPELLVPGNASPHVYSLRPSDARRLEAAELVLWVGPVYESFLAKPLAALGEKARIVTLSQAEGIAMLPARGGGAWDAHEHGPAHRHAHGAAHDDDDGHLWLDPENGKAIVGIAVAALSALDPANAARYAGNGDRARGEIDALDARIEARLAPFGTTPFIVFHDAYQYFERRYGLRAAGSLTVSAEQKPGARRVREIRARIEQAGAACVFAEPQFEPSIIDTIIAGTKARSAVLDPLGAGLPEGPTLYGAMLDRLAASLAGCLGG